MDTNIKQLILEEEERQATQISLIASENYISGSVKAALASGLSNKYAEGYPGARYYAGNHIVDKIEQYTVDLAQKVFETTFHVNVQPLSGSPANLAVYTGLLNPGDTILAMSLDHGGHLTHGHKVNITGKLYNFVHYGVNKEDGLIDYNQVLEFAQKHKPKLIVCGATAYPAYIDFAAFARIARVTNSLLMVDMSHFAGLVAGKVYPTPFLHADIITTTTHKTLRGPRGAMIFCRPDLAKQIDKAVFPGLQGGPHINNIAGIAVCLEEALTPAFQLYARQIINNARTLAYSLQSQGLKLVADGTETHLILVDLAGTKLRGQEAQNRLEDVSIICNKNTIPFDINPPHDPSGIRLGTPAITTRGMKEADMENLAEIINTVLTSAKLNPRYNEIMQMAKEEIGRLSKRFRIPSV